MTLRFGRYLLPALLTGALAGAPACQSSSTDRWVTTSNTNVDINWDEVAKAYQEAEGPADFEKRVNEIYTGDEIISIAVADKDDKSQVVTGFFDHNTNGTLEDGEKIFEITRRITGEGAGEMQVAGYGAYAGYHSPMLSIMTGMMLGSWMSGAFSPGYAPAGAYTTPVSRREALSQQRSAYRAANPSKFSTPRASQSGRSYGNQGRDFKPRSTPSRSGGGVRFGAKASAAPARRLDA